MLTQRLPWRLPTQTPGPTHSPRLPGGEVFHAITGSPTRSSTAVLGLARKLSSTRSRMATMA
eukprot:11974333-Alexandrium_andersonii.AAC.1